MPASSRHHDLPELESLSGSWPTTGPPHRRESMGSFPGGAGRRALHAECRVLGAEFRPADVRFGRKGAATTRCLAWSVLFKTHVPPIIHACPARLCSNPWCRPLFLPENTRSPEYGPPATWETGDRAKRSVELNRLKKRRLDWVWRSLRAIRWPLIPIPKFECSGGVRRRWQRC
jgi:hypothetical protein